MSRWAILGCGYVGKRLASKLLAENHEVTATSRSEEGKASLKSRLPCATVHCYTLGNELAGCSEYETIVISAPPDANAPAAERELAKQLQDGQRLIYLSTTGVYAPAGGDQVADDYELAPGSDRSRRRLLVEEALSEIHAQTHSLRIPGIYGPERGVHARMRRGDYRLIGAADTFVSRIYVDDLVDAIILLGREPELVHKAYVIGDEEPTTARAHARGVSERLGLPMPKSVETSEVSPAVQAMLGADCRVVPRRLHKLGWRARYPSWREGLEAAIRAEARS